MFKNVYQRNKLVETGLDCYYVSATVISVELDIFKHISMKIKEICIYLQLIDIMLFLHTYFFIFKS